MNSKLQDIINSLPLYAGDSGGSCAALFDLDGVVFDTEPQYSRFWEQQFIDYYDGQKELAHKIKGQTLVQIYDQYFSGNKEHLQSIITKDLNKYEEQMEYDYVPGFLEFIANLKVKGIKTAVVTSSNLPKMLSVYKKRPEFQSLFNAILTSEDFEKSKPDPDCYLKAAARLGCEINNCIVLEDSFNGLRSGCAAGMKVVGLSTTNSEESIASFCDVVIPNYL